MWAKGHKKSFFGTHQLSDKRIYNIYYAIKERCYNHKTKCYERYGGRGIRMCEEWLNDFQAFYDWSVANGYKEEILPNGINKWTIDRIDTNGNYEPSNCRWITVKEQSRNTRKNKIVEFNGESYTIAEWSEKLGIPYSRIYNRLDNGWSVEKALSTPVNAKHINKKYLKELQNG